jgi:hypothetical protein
MGLLTQWGPDVYTFGTESPFGKTRVRVVFPDWYSSNPPKSLRYKSRYLDRRGHASIADIS